MSEFEGFRERTKLDNLLRHLLWEDDPRDESIDDFEKLVEDSFEVLYDRLEDISPKLRRDDDRLFGAMMDFTAVQNSVYFKLGVLTGFRLYRDLDMSYEKQIKSVQLLFADARSQWERQI